MVKTVLKKVLLATVELNQLLAITRSIKIHTVAVMTTMEAITLTVTKRRRAIEVVSTILLRVGKTKKETTTDVAKTRASLELTEKLLR